MSHRILIVAPSWIGDTIMMQPLLMQLRAYSPEVELHVLAPAWSAPLLARMPEVTTCIENPFTHGAFAWRERRALGKCLATSGFTEAYVLPNSWKSALVPFFARIPKRTGYTGEARYWLLNNRQRLDETTMPRLVDRYVALAGVHQALQNPRLTSSIEQQQATRTALGLAQDITPIIFCPGAEYGPAKRWPARHFAALAEKISSSGNGNPVWIVGSNKDAEIGAEIEQRSGGIAQNLCGRTSLIQAIDLIASARAVISNDSGLMHIAAALDRPLIALYGSSSPAYTPPLSSRAKIISLALPCSPCFKRECPFEHFNCLNQLEPEGVMTALAHAN